ncbi:MAG: hypothetical protein WDZ56_01865 [Candidatus Paceibacterota bacterium]
MEQNNNQPTPQSTPQAPEIPESEMKLPEEQFGNQPLAEKAPKHYVNPLLIVGVILLLTALAIVVIWGEELIGMFLPDSTVQLEPLPEAEEVNATETELEEMERELEEMDMSSFEEELDTIEAEMEAELETETEA